MLDVWTAPFAPVLRDALEDSPDPPNDRPRIRCIGSKSEYEIRMILQVLPDAG